MSNFVIDRDFGLFTFSYPSACLRSCFIDGILMLIVAWPLSGRWLMAIGLLLCIRPDILLRLLNIEPQDLEFAEIRLLSVVYFSFLSVPFGP